MTQVEQSLVASSMGKWKGYPAYKDSGVEWLGEIPEHWEVRRLKFLTKSMIAGPFGSSLTKDLYTTQGYRVYGQEQVIPADFSKGDYYISKEMYISMERYAIRTGDVLVSCVGTFGKVAVVPPEAEPGIINPRLAKLIPNRDIVVAAYLGLLLRSQIAFEQMEQVSRGGTMGVINLGLLSEVLLPLPSVIEQYAITDFLDQEISRIKELIAKKERLIELLQEKRAALISHAVTKGLDAGVKMKDSGVEWLGEIPEHWEVRRLKFVTSFITSGSRGWAQYYSDDGPIFLRIGNLSRASIELDLQDIQHVSPPSGTEGERTRVKQFDVLISVTAYIGSVAAVTEDIGEAYVNQHIALTRPLRSVVNSRWLAYGLLSRVGQDQFQTLLYGGTKDGLGLSDVSNLLVLGPPIAEQQTIASYLDHETAKIDALISRIRDGIEKLKEYSTALISAAVTGKIDVRGFMN